MAAAAAEESKPSRPRRRQATKAQFSFMPPSEEAALNRALLASLREQKGGLEGPEDARGPEGGLLPATAPQPRSNKRKGSALNADGESGGDGVQPLRLGRRRTEEAVSADALPHHATEAMHSEDSGHDLAPMDVSPVADLLPSTAALREARRTRPAVQPQRQQQRQSQPAAATGHTSTYLGRPQVLPPTLRTINQTGAELVDVLSRNNYSESPVSFKQLQRDLKLGAVRVISMASEQGQASSSSSRQHRTASPAENRAPTPTPRPAPADPVAGSGAGSGAAIRAAPVAVKPAPLSAAGRSRSPTLGAASAQPPPTSRGRARTHAFEVPAAPVYHPTAEEFQNPLQYIASIRASAEQYGICKIVPPKEWRPTCQLDPQNFKFGTRLQRIHQLCRRWGPNEEYLECLKEHLKAEHISLYPMPTINGIEVDLYQLSLSVRKHGGLQAVINKQKWKRVGDGLHVPRSAHGRESRLQGIYYKYILSFEMLEPDEKEMIRERVLVNHRDSVDADDEEAAFGFETGRAQTLPSFKKLAQDFKKAWFRSYSDIDKVSPEVIEREYWKIVEDRDRHVAVNYGSDIDTTIHGSGFPVGKPKDPYARFGWNLNVLPGLPESILKHISGISGISMPWLYVGMLFSSFCWHNEDNYLYSINYMHFGAGKTWYGVPGWDAKTFEQSFRRHLPEEFQRRPGLLHDIVTQMSPQKLLADGVQVCSTVQRAREFVVTFPQAYHAGFSHGFNCGEAVNFAAVDWLPFGYQAIEDYRLQRRPVSLDHERLVLETARREESETAVYHTLPEVLRTLYKQRQSRERLRAKGVTRTLDYERYKQYPVQDDDPKAPMSGNIFSTYLGSGTRMATEKPKFPTMQHCSAFRAQASQHPLIGHQSQSCNKCLRICFASMVVVTDRPFPQAKPAVAKPIKLLKTLCPDCACEATEWREELMTLVFRCSIDELVQLLGTMKQRIQQARGITPSPMPGPGPTTARSGAGSGPACEIQCLSEHTLQPLPSGLEGGSFAIEVCEDTPTIELRVVTQDPQAIITCYGHRRLQETSWLQSGQCYAFRVPTMSQLPHELTVLVTAVDWISQTAYSIQLLSKPQPTPTA